MRQLLAILGAMAVLLCISGCASSTKYLISFYSTDDLKHPEFFSAMQSVETEVVRDGGRFLVDPIRIDRELRSNASPAYQSTINADFILISAFDTSHELEAHLSHASQNNLPEGITLSASVTARLFKPMPFMPEASVIGSIKHRGEPAFILLNGISMNSMANPMTGIRMMRYMWNNLPKLKARDVTLLEAFEVVERVRGEYPYDMLFLTEWPNQSVFDEFHADPTFIELAQTTRNRAFHSFSEQKGLVEFDWRSGE